MNVIRTRVFALLSIALLWAVTPAMACVLPSMTMTPAERQCCHHMAEKCGSSMMPARHSCCQTRGQSSTVLAPQAGTLGRQVTVAVLPTAASLPALSPEKTRFYLLFHGPPPAPSPGCSSVLRI